VIALRRNLTALIASVLIVPLAAGADDPRAESIFSFSGFGTLGLTHNSTGRAEYRRDITQPGGVGHRWSADVDSRLGLQLNARPSAEVEGVVQVVSKYGHDGSYSPALTWAFLSYTPDPKWKARAGRLGWDVYMLSDSRNVGYAYLWARPPVDYFGPLQVSHIDGADVVLKTQTGGGLLSTKLYWGRANEKLPSPPDADYDLAGTRVAGVNLDFQKGDWLFRAGYTSLKLRKDLPAFDGMLAALRATGSPGAASVADDLALAGKTVRIASAGVVWEHGPWQAQVMANRLTSNTPTYPQKDSGYLLLGYRSGKWTPFVTLSGTRSKATQRATGLPTPNALDTAVATSLAAAQSRQVTLAIGARWDLMRNADLKFQLEQVRVHDRAALLWRNAQADWDGRATVFSVVLDFVF